ncbi:MAG: hypothetical protein QOG46_1629 [Pseudonocardiales bacterium]|jgi:hypothetical protein|nr:hypothetical protein [Pseudonocardiales bacterium]
MPPRARWLVLAVLVVVFGLTIWAAGQRGEPLPAGAERLGPEAGEQVVDYLRRAERSLPAGNSGPVWALAQLDSYLTPAPAAELARGVRLSRAIIRVPLPRIQTALITRDLPGQRPVAELTEALWSAAADRAAVASRQHGRRAALATAEAAQLRTSCACVVALLVFGDGDALRVLAARPGVRAVHAALLDTPIQDLAISPLLPEQLERAGPVPDDGPVPP